MKKIIIVGAGFSGAVLARKIAEELGKHVLVVEKRSTYGGNAYDEYDQYGILIQKYGPHFFNTNKYQLVSFLEQYGELIRHDAHLLSFIDGNYVQLPFNFRTVQQLVGDQKAEVLLSAFRKEFCGRDRVPIGELLNSSDQNIKCYAELLLEKAYKTYTAKQWGLDPETLDKSIMDRVPMAMSFDARYLNKDFQYLPKYGFSKLFDNMLNHPYIDVLINTNAFDHISFDDNMHRIKYDGEDVELLIFTGAIDELFHLKYGRLPYRSLNITYEYHDDESVLPCEIISYPQAKGYTRKTEYKKFTYGITRINKSVVATEYPIDYDPNSEIANIPYYPVLTAESMNQYKLYEKEAQKYENIVLCGRLAEFRYYNMDVCIEHALNKFEKIKERLK